MPTPVLRVTRVVLQVVALAAAAWVLVRLARPNWGAITALHVTIRWGLLALASVLWLASFAFLVQLWAGSLAWWNARLGGLDALRIFVLSNLARYIPGAIWQFTGLAVFAAEAQVAPLAAAGAVLLQQLVLLATGLLLTLACAPALLGPVAAWPVGAQVAVFAGGLVLLLWALPAALPGLQGLLERLLRRQLPLPRPPRAGFIGYVAGSALGWVGYGLAFWLFARAVLGSESPGVALAATAFVASYVAGIIAVFAPGGIVVREAALVAALSPHVGADRAFVLAIGSRLWLVALEIVGALAVIAYGFRTRKTN